MPHDPKTLATIAIVVLFAAVNIGPLLSWLAGAAGGVKLPSLGGSPADRTPGAVLDCLNSDLDYLRANTDAPAELLKQVEALAPYLMHKKPGQLA